MPITGFVSDLLFQRLQCNLITQKLLMQYAMASSIAKYGQTHPKTNPWGEKKVYIFIYKACLPLAESLAAISFPLRQDSYHIFNAALKMPRFNGFIFCYTLAGATLVL